jgi:hypothetical protein
MGLALLDVPMQIEADAPALCGTILSVHPVFSPFLVRKYPSYKNLSQSTITTN